MKLGTDRREFLIAAASCLALLAAYPPVGWSWLAWLAPCGWVALIRKPSWESQRPYRMLFAVGFLYWLVLTHWIRLPHWSAYFGWPVLAAYLGIYLPLFVALSRRLVHRWRVPAILSAAIVWTSLEFFRGHFLTGFSISLLSHSQFRLPLLLQTCELWGAYGLSFMMVAVAACAESGWHGWRASGSRLRFQTIWPGFAALAILALVLGYGRARSLRIEELLESADATRLKVALVQGSLDTQFDGNSDRIQQAYFDYSRLSRDIAEKHADLDLMIWPESMFTATEAMVSYSEPLKLVDGWDGSLAQLRRRLDDFSNAVMGRMRWLVDQTQTPMLVGTAWDHYEDGVPLRYNAAVLIDDRGDVAGRYNKMHPVMFGEYIPFGKLLPWLYKLTPMGSGLQPGESPQAFEVSGRKLCASICFENTVPHLVRDHVRQLSHRGEAPDLLATLSNDGWFWGSSLLDHHLACGVFRAVELRRPMLIAANTGLSAWIDATGRIRAEGPRRDWEVLIAEPRLPRRPWGSFYESWGDLLSIVCLAVTSLAAFQGGADWVAGASRQWRGSRS